MRKIMAININNGRCRFNFHCFLGPNYLEIAENCISKHLNFKIFRRGMPLDPPRKLIHILVPFYFLKSGTPALDIPELCSFKLFTQKGFTDLHCYLSPLSFVCKMLTYSQVFVYTVAGNENQNPIALVMVLGTSEGAEVSKAKP